ncbi:Mog1p/PsbP-like protein [Rhizodiscina lignyota]|uniref:Mog1p/PsbP-like protein n=1 Tax=Rhizodiscina lignyota TaxID=1504668 RepID=A0A9P4IIT9_9PEZI|nr:Mog1p/PsbP-like protein [Rhizodiscina lignyota]
MSSFVSTELFGGAIVVDLPAGFGDASSIRQVPDNQEVYLDANGLTSIIFDILERVDESTAATDQDALKYHFHDIASGTNDTTRFWHFGSATLTKLPNTPAYVLFATQEPSRDAPQRGPQPDFTGILLTLVRLAKEKTDIVIAVNVPHVPGEYRPEDVDLPAQKLSPHLEAATAARQKILETFEIKDWSLFVNEE